MLIKQGKTNIKYLLIVVILAVIVGGGLWIYLTYFYYDLPYGSEVFSTKEECEKETGCECDIVLCDVDCPTNFKKGWRCIGPKGICGPQTIKHMRLGVKQGVFYCDNSCATDNDCKYTCGCGAININETCHDEGIIYDCVGHEVRCENSQCVEGKEIISKQVTITVDKTDCMQGDMVNITVKNNLDKSIWDFGPCGDKPFWKLHKLEGGKWREMMFSFPDIIEKDIGGDRAYIEVCDLIVCEIPEPVELKSNSEIGYEWSLGKSICEWPLSPIGMPETAPKKIEPGTYRLSLSYGLTVSDEDPFKVLNISTIYSNEFTIKEKTLTVKEECELMDSEYCELHDDCVFYEQGCFLGNKEYYEKCFCKDWSWNINCEEFCSPPPKSGPPLFCMNNKCIFGK